MTKAATSSLLEWKQTRQGLLITGLVELILAYAFGSWAIDSGSWWHYLLTIIFAIGATQSLVRAVLSHDKK